MTDTQIQKAVEKIAREVRFELISIQKSNMRLSERVKVERALGLLKALQLLTETN